MKIEKPIRECLDELYALHKASIDVRHGIQKGTEWDYFQPSHFVYSFFAFNSIYGYDWHQSLAEQVIHDWHKLGNNGKTVRSAEEEQYKNLLCCCCMYLGNDPPALFVKRLQRYLPDDVDAVGEVQRVTHDLRTQEQRGHFIPAFTRVIRNGGLQGDWKRLLDFVYLVRCNIFHGTKHITELTGSDERHVWQRRRLEIYAAILQATNTTFFHAAGKATGWQSGDGEVCYLKDDDE